MRRAVQSRRDSSFATLLKRYRGASHLTQEALAERAGLSRDEEFEIERLVAAAKTVTGMPASKALFSLLGAVLDFADSCSPGDDLTLLVVRRREATLRMQPRSREKDFPFPNRRPASVARPKNADRTE